MSRPCVREAHYSGLAGCEVLIHEHIDGGCLLATKEFRVGEQDYLLSCDWVSDTYLDDGHWWRATSFAKDAAALKVIVLEKVRELKQEEAHHD